MAEDMEDKKEPDRAERRRQKKEQGSWNEEEWGPRDYRVFDKCPVCGCPARYTVEAMRGAMSEERLKDKPPAIGAMTFNYDTPLYRYRIDVVVDCCCKCGTIYTIARSVLKKPLIMNPKGGDTPGLMRGR